MERETASAEAIQKEIAKRIAAQNEHQQAYAEIKVQLPERKTPDENGCNWDVAFVSVPGTVLDCAYRAAAEVKRLYALQE